MATAELTTMSTYSYGNYYTITSSGLSYYTASQYSTPINKETKKEKQARIAKEKMHASWKTYNELKPLNSFSGKIYQIKQICKPRHILKNH